VQVPSIEEPTLQAICNVLADTYAGLTGSEIAKLLRGQGIADPEPNATKRDRLFQALSERQRRDGCGNQVIAFINAAMNPVRYATDIELFESRRGDLNEVLRFAGYNIGTDGKVARVNVATTLTEAQSRARTLEIKLRSREVHPDVLRFCKAEFLQDNYFHAVLEATKSVADKLRTLSGCSEDGAALVDCALGGDQPRVAINARATPSQLSEHRGFAGLLKGMFSVFRNPTAHEPKVTWSVSEQDALDLLSLASYLHRRLDAAVRIS
jgi:uncharacterized protein (TIGR02391 family)